VAQFTLQLDPANGPVLTVVIGVSVARGDALMTAGQPVPAGISARALIDTGASCTCVDPSILAKLALTPTGTVSVHTPSTGPAAHLAEQYDVSLIIPGCRSASCSARPSRDPRDGSGPFRPGNRLADRP
jgi:hypothetical protein